MVVSLELCPSVSCNMTHLRCVRQLLVTCAGKQDLRRVWWCILMRRRLGLRAATNLPKWQTELKWVNNNKKKKKKYVLSNSESVQCNFFIWNKRNVMFIHHTRPPTKSLFNAFLFRYFVSILFCYTTVLSWTTARNISLFILSQLFQFLSYPRFSRV